MVDTYKKSQFVAPHAHGSTQKPDLTRLPAHMRNAVTRPAPVEANEAMAHLQTKTAQVSVPAARIRAYVVDTDAHRPRPRIGVYAIDPEGKSHLADIFLEVDQAEILYAALGAAIAEQRKTSA